MLRCSLSQISNIHSTWVHPCLHRMACWHIMYNTWTCLELHYFLIRWQTYGPRESNQKSSREESKEESSLPLLLPTEPPSPPQPSTDQHMWWRMTHLFFYKGCVYVKLLKCIKMSSTLGGPPRLPWKITRWKYNFSAGESGIWTEFCLTLFLFTFRNLLLHSLLFCFSFSCY